MSINSELAALENVGGAVWFDGPLRENVVFPRTRYPIALYGRKGWTDQAVQMGSSIQALDPNLPTVDMRNASNARIGKMTAWGSNVAGIAFGGEQPVVNIGFDDVQAHSGDLCVALYGSAEKVWGHIRCTEGRAAFGNVPVGFENYLDTKHGSSLNIDANFHTGYAIDLALRVSRSLKLSVTNHGFIPWEQPGKSSQGTLRLRGEIYVVDIPSYYSEGVCHAGESDVVLDGVRSITFHEPWFGMKDNDGSSGTRHVLDASRLSATRTGRRPVHIQGGNFFPVFDPNPQKVQFYGGGGFRSTSSFGADERLDNPQFELALKMEREAAADLEVKLQELVERGITVAR